MRPEERKLLLDCIRGVPEWQTALIWEQDAALNKGAATLSGTANMLEQGFADSVLRPDLYHSAGRSHRRDWNTDRFLQTAHSLGRSLAALELLSVLADAIPRDLSDVVLHARDAYYGQLASLLKKHGHTPEVPQ